MKYLILGGGITGLSAAWFLKKREPTAQITLLEKTDRLGGWIRSSTEGGFFFEKGPRTFQLGRSPHLLALIQELNLETISSHPAAQLRFILYKGKLRTPLSFLPRFAPYFFRELFVKPTLKKDESIYDFASRRFSPKIAEIFFDPLTLGIYAGDSRKLSLCSCFPAFSRWEQEKGSVLKGLFSAPKQAKGLFTLKGGMETLIHALEKRLSIDIVLNCPVEKLAGNEVFAGGKIWTADHVLSALPLPLPKNSLWVVNLAFAGDVLPKKGFGYLVPTQEGQSVLGAIFDSVIFPEQSQNGETRLTVMVRASEEKPLEAALSALSTHLGIVEQPLYSSVFLAKEAIPQMEVGCGYSENLSVDGCIQRGKRLV